MARKRQQQPRRRNQRPPDPVGPASIGAEDPGREAPNAQRRSDGVPPGDVPPLEVVGVAKRRIEKAVQFASLFSAAMLVVSFCKNCQTTRDSNRPWITVEAAPPRVFDGGKPIKTSVLLKNTGNSPALDVRYLLGGFTGPALDPSELEACPRYAFAPHMKAVVGPAAKLETETYMWVDQPVVPPGVADGLVAVFAFGRVDYRDVYGREHSTRFCFAYRENQVPYPTQCSYHNDADRDLPSPEIGPMVWPCESAKP